MKAVQKLVLAVGAVAFVSGCSGKASPEVDITCSTSSNDQAFETFLMIQKLVSAADSAIGGVVPANGITATVISPTSAIEICPGDCLDGNGSFRGEQEVTTDDFGVFLYTVGITDPTVEFSGDIIEVFSSTNTCFSQIDLVGDGI